MMPFHNIFNEWYAAQISKKIRAVNEMKAAKGKRVSSTVAYGYKKIEGDKEQWYIDEPVAEVVRKIFELCLSGKGPSQIARQLEREKILTPTAYYYSVGRNACNPMLVNIYRWSTETIINILDNRQYTGCTVNGKTTTISYKIHKVVEKSKEEYQIIPNTQEAIINENTWLRVHELRKNKRRNTATGRKSLFSGLVYCADCGKKMYLCRSSTMKQKEYFNCSSYRKQKKSTCTSHQITVEAIEEIVLSYLKRVSDFVIDHEGDFVDIAIQHSRLLSRKEVAKKARQVSEAENRIKALNKIIQSLYEDKVMGKITEERFVLMSEAYEQEQQQLKETVENSQSEINRYDEINDNINNFVSLVVRTGRIRKLTPEIVRLLIDKVIVSEKVKTEDGYKRTVTICLTHVGEIELP